LMPDHVPTTKGGAPDAESQENFAFAFGYIRGLIQAEKHIA